MNLTTRLQLFGHSLAYRAYGRMSAVCVSLYIATNNQTFYRRHRVWLAKAHTQRVKAQNLQTGA